MEGFLKLSTQVTVTVLMIDSSDHITGKTGLAAGITKYLTKVGGTPTSATMTTTELDATNAKGLYSLVFTTSHTDTLGEFQLHLTASGADPSDLKWQVSTYLPGEAATLQTDQAVNTTKIGGTTQTARDIGASVLLSPGAGTGQLDFTSGVVKANATQWLSGTIPAVNITGVPLVDLKYTLGTISPAAAGSVRADAVTGAVGSVTGAVGSVTGAVGSVTGNVGGNVAGSVGSVTGAVGSVAGNVGGNVVGTVASVVGAVGSVTGITASNIGDIKTQTDKLVFTVANQVDANIQYVNDVLVNGVGSVGNPWGP